MWLFTTKTTQGFWDARFADDDGSVFGNEGEGAPAWLHEELRDSRVTIPHANPDLRSLNLSDGGGIACYEALRQVTLLHSMSNFVQPGCRRPRGAVGGTSGGTAARHAPARRGSADGRRSRRAD